MKWKLQDKVRVSGRFPVLEYFINDFYCVNTNLSHEPHSIAGVQSSYCIGHVRWSDLGHVADYSPQVTLFEVA